MNLNKNFSKPEETVIEPTRDYFRIDWREIFHYRDLLFLLVRRDFVSRYKQTLLGPAWFVLQPLLTTLVFTLIFGRFAKIPTNNVPPVLFYLCGLLAWDYFSQCVLATSAALLSNVNLFTKVYFPRLIIPFSIVISNLMKYGLQLAMFLGFYAYFKFFTNGVHPLHLNVSVILLPAAVFLTALTSLGAGLWVCALTVRYRDFHHLIGFVVQLWMYLTPIIYPLSVVPERWKWLALLNPMAEVVEYYRFAFFGTGTLTAQGLFISLGITLVLFLSGLYMFNRVEKNFIDTI